MSAPVPVPHPPATPRQTTPRAILAAPSVDPKTLSGIATSIKDRIYQRSFNLRKTFRELDKDGNGIITFETFQDEMSRAYQLNDAEKKVLQSLLKEADFNQDGALDFREFCEMLKIHDHTQPPVLSEREKRRFQGKGVMDAKMQRAVVLNPEHEVALSGGVPTNELGPMNIECPFGVLGDSERMDAVIASYLHMKYDKLTAVFNRHDSNRDGFVTYDEFRKGMKEVDQYVFDDEIDNLLGSLDRKKRGLISISDFVRGAGQEYLKKKAHRSSAQENPFKWADNGKAGKKKTESQMANQEKKKLKKAMPTKSAELRAKDARQKMQDQMRDEQYAAKLTPRKKSDENDTTPRLPKIKDASPIAESS